MIVVAARREESRASGDDGKDFGHLEQRERGAEAAADAAAEGDPGVGARRAVEEALGPEGVRLGVEVFASVQQPNARRHRDAGGQLETGDGHRFEESAVDDREHGAQPQRLPGDREGVALPALAEALAMACVWRHAELVSAPGQALEDDGVIVGYTALLNPLAMGHAFEVLVNVDLTHKDRDTVERFEAEVAALDEVIEVRRTFGLPDYLVRVGTPDLEAFEAFVTAGLGAVPGIAKVDSHLTMKVVKSPERPEQPEPGGSRRRAG